ncbi:MAG: hypothetical protein AB8H86_19130 [Polyangiales bacterium]
MRCNSMARPAEREPAPEDRLVVRAEMLEGEREANRREIGRPMARIAGGITLGVTAVVGASLIFAFSERFTSHTRSMQPNGSFAIEESFAPGWGLLCLAGLVALAGGILFVSGISRFERLARRNRMLEERMLEL